MLNAVNRRTLKNKINTLNDIHKIIPITNKSSRNFSFFQRKPSDYKTANSYSHLSDLSKSLRFHETRTEFYQWMGGISNKTRIELLQIGKRINQLTGYNEIMSLKEQVAENERKIHLLRDNSRVSKKAYEEAVARRSSSQRELNDLLQRKSSWSEADILRFTELVRTDHTRELEEAQARAQASDADSTVERQFDELMRSILSRYHEEQVWSDKIRSLSTYGSLVALGLNMVIFILALVLVEPWKRKKLLETFEGRIYKFTEENQRQMETRMTELMRSIQEMQLMESPVTLGGMRQDSHEPVPLAVMSGDKEQEKVDDNYTTANTVSSIETISKHRFIIMTTFGAFVGGLFGVFLRY